jgi:hypothetical protein
MHRVAARPANMVSNGALGISEGVGNSSWKWALEPPL